MIPAACLRLGTGEKIPIMRNAHRHLCSNPVRVVAFNTDEEWSRDVSDELRERCAQRGAVPEFLIEFLEAHDTGGPFQLPLPMAI